MCSSFCAISQIDETVYTNCTTCQPNSSTCLICHWIYRIYTVCKWNYWICTICQRLGPICSICQWWWVPWCYPASLVTTSTRSRNLRNMHKRNIWATLAMRRSQRDLSEHRDENHRNMHRRNVWATFAMRRYDRNPPKDTQMTQRASPCNYRDMHIRKVWATLATCTIQKNILLICAML